MPLQFSFTSPGFMRAFPKLNISSYQMSRQRRRGVWTWSSWGRYWDTESNCWLSNSVTFEHKQLKFCPLLVIIITSVFATGTNLRRYFSLTRCIWCPGQEDLAASNHSKLIKSVSNHFQDAVMHLWRCSEIIRFGQQKNTWIIRCSHYWRPPHWMGPTLTAQQRAECPSLLSILTKSSWVSCTRLQGKCFVIVSITRV